MQGGHGDERVDGSDDDDSDFLNGVDGNDIILAGLDDIVTSGDGDDLVITDNTIEIVDFDAKHDRNEVVHEGPEPFLTMTAGENELLLIADDTLVATVTGLDTLDMSRIASIAT